MAPVTGAFVGMNNPVRGFNGGGLPWVIASGEGELSANGELEVHVRGLVLDPNDPRVPANLKGVNPFNAFGVFVSCLTNADPKGLDPHTAVAAGNFPATSPGGNMNAETHIAMKLQSLHRTSQAFAPRTSLSLNASARVETLSSFGSL